MKISKASRAMKNMKINRNMSWVQVSMDSVPVQISSLQDWVLEQFEYHKDWRVQNLVRKRRARALYLNMIENVQSTDAEEAIIKKSHLHGFRRLPCEQS